MTDRAVSSAARERGSVGRQPVALAPATTRAVFIDFEDGERMVRVTAGLRERGYIRAAGTVEAALRRPHPEKTMEAVWVLQNLPAEAVDGLPLVPTNGANPRK